MPEAEKNKIAIGAAGLVLGFIVTAAGFIYYKTKARGLYWAGTMLNKQSADYYLLIYTTVRLVGQEVFHASPMDITKDITTYSL